MMNKINDVLSCCMDIDRHNEIETESNFIITYNKSFRDQDKLFNCINKIENDILWKKRTDFKYAMISEKKY